MRTIARRASSLRVFRELFNIARSRFVSTTHSFARDYGGMSAVQFRSLRRTNFRRPFTGDYRRVDPATRVTSPLIVVRKRPFKPPDSSRSKRRVRAGYLRLVGDVHARSVFRFDHRAYVWAHGGGHSEIRFWSSRDRRSKARTVRKLNGPVYYRRACATAAQNEQPTVNGNVTQIICVRLKKKIHGRHDDRKKLVGRAISGGARSFFSRYGQ